MKNVLVLFCVSMAANIFASVQRHVADNDLQIGWVYSVKSGDAEQLTLTLWGCTNMPSSGTLTIPSTLETLDGSLTVSQIAESAFSHSSLRSVTMPSSVVEIGEDAFACCERLTSVSISGEGLERIGGGAFYDCESLSKVSIPSSVTNIGHHAFYKCIGLKSLKLPNSLEEVGEKAFLACENLDIATFPARIRTIGSSAFEGTSVKNVDMSAGLKVLDARAFAFCEDLQTVVIRSSSVKMGICVFYSCVNLESVAMAEGISEIPLQAFANDVDLTDVILPSTLQSIGEQAFWKCNLKVITLPESLKTVGPQAFYQNENIEDLCILSPDLTVGSSSFSRVPMLTLGPKFRNFNLLKGANAAIQADDIFIQLGMESIPDQAFQSVWCWSISIPASVSSIGANAFHSCWATNIVIDGTVSLCASAFEGSSVQDLRLNSKNATIPERAFYGSAVTNITLSSNIERIGDEAFFGCEALVNLNWPKQLRFIGNSAFAGCEALTNLNLEVTQVQKIGEKAFSYCTGLIDPVVMPSTLKEIGDEAFYGAAIWSDSEAVSSHAQKNSTIHFLGLPPTVGNNVFATTYSYDSTLYVFNSIYLGTYETQYAQEWEKAIDEWSKKNDTEGKWEWLEFCPVIVVEPIAWEMNKPLSGDQSLTIAWHLPTNDTYTIEQAMKDLVEKDYRYAIWRSMDNPQSLDDVKNFQKAVCIKQNVAETNYVDETFGSIGGMYPVCYWVEVQFGTGHTLGDALCRERPDTEPAMCMTRRRFGLSVGISVYDHSQSHPEELPACTNNAIQFAQLLLNGGGVCDSTHVKCLRNEDAKISDISNAISGFPQIGGESSPFLPGDIAFIMIVSHGGTDNGGFVRAYDGPYFSDQLKKDLKWIDNAIGVRVVAIMPFCHSEYMCEGLRGKSNLSWVCAARKSESANGGKRTTELCYYMVNFGISQFCADRSGISGSPARERDSFDFPGNIGKSDGLTSLGEAARYAKTLAYGQSSKKSLNVGHPAHAVIVDQGWLDTIPMSQGYSAIKKTPNVGKFDVSADDSGIIRLKFDDWDGARKQILWYKCEDDAKWSWIDAGIFADKVDLVDDPILLGRWHRYYRPFGAKGEYELAHIGNVIPNKEYSFIMQGVNEFGFGMWSEIKKCRTGDLATDPASVFVEMLKQKREYRSDIQGGLGYVDVEVSPHGDEYYVSTRIVINGKETVYSCYVNKVSDEGYLACTCSRVTELRMPSLLMSAKAMNVSNDSVSLKLSAYGAEGTWEDIVFAGLPISREKNLDERIELTFEYDDRVEFDFAGSVVGGGYVFSSVNLPPGLSIDDVTGVISGTPMEPGSYLVQVTVTSKADSSQTETVELLITITKKDSEENIARDSVEEDVSEDGVSFGIDVDVDSVGSYELVLALATTNGVSLGKYSQTKDCVSGRNHYVVIVSADAIRTLAQNGPYVITKATLQLGDEEVCIAENLYETKMVDFATYYGFGGGDSGEPDDPAGWLSEKVGDYTWFYSAEGDRTVIEKRIDYDYVSWGECAVDPDPVGDLNVPSMLGGEAVVSIGESAFEDCDGLSSVMLPSCVTNLGNSAFYGCLSLTNLVFEGNAPSVGDCVFTSVGYSCTVTVYEDALGWDDDGDGYWNDLEIVWRKRGSDPISETVTITFDPNGGSCEVSESSVESGAMLANLPTASRTGYVFKGWFTKRTGGEQVTARTVFSEAQTVYAQWEQVVYSPEVDGDSDDVTQDGAAVGQTVRMYTFDVKTGGYTNWVCTGWIGTGDVPATGTSNEVSFVVKDGGTIKWLYQTNYWVSVGAVCGTDGGHAGRVTVPVESGALGDRALSACACGFVSVLDAAGETITNELWAAAGTNLTAEARAYEGWVFAGWREADGGRGATALPEGTYSGVSDLLEDGHAGRMTLPVAHPWLLQAVFTQQVCNVTFDLGEQGTRTGGGALMQSVAWGGAADAPKVVAKTGWKFVGWDVTFTNVTQTMTVTAQYEEFVQVGVFFAESSAFVAEGDAFEVIVAGGGAEKASSVQVYLTYLTAVAADIDLKTATIDGVTPKGGIKFPLTLSWAEGEIANRVIRIPIKTDKAVEGDEMLVFQLAAAQGQTLGEASVCRVTIHDTGYDAIKAKIEMGSATKSEQAAWKKLAVNDGVSYVAGLASPADGGKVTGSGYCAAGKKVTLKATANKGYVFAGWWEGAVGGGTPTLPDGDPVSRLSSLVLAEMPTNDVELTAMFITSGRDKSNIVARVNGMDFEPASAGTRDACPYLATNIWTGVYLEWPVAASALSETTVKVAGLPSGLKFTAKPVTSKTTSGRGKSKVTTVVTNIPANTIYGAPTAASKTKKVKVEGEGERWMAVPSQVKVTVTTAGKSSQTFEIDTTVDPLPSWAIGTFTGPSYAVGDGTPTLPDTGSGVDGYYVVGSAPRADRWETNGTVSVTIGANGKISAKQPVDGKATSFVASWFDSYDAGEEAFRATLTAKVGKEIVTNEMSVCGGLVEAAISADAGGTRSVASVTNGYIEADLFDAWQYDWKSEPWKSIGQVLDKETLIYYVMSDGSCVDVDAQTTVLGDDGVIGKVTLKFAASGAVTVSGDFAQLDVDGQLVYKKGKLQTVKATGSATLVPVGEDYGLVFVYLAPKGLQPHARCVEASWAQHIVTWEYGDVEHWYVCFKPVIYLYPETNTTCRVQLSLSGELTCTYPAYGADGWHDFIASPDGTLTFPNGSRYYCLYWEGETDAEWDFSHGYCVKGYETAAFLADVLLKMGLTFREANEFIIYWLPLMQDNPYNIISFQGENYANAAKLSVDPQPDSLLRVFMAWRPSDRSVDIPAPVIVPFARKGFTVVEWGGTKVGD